MKKTKFFALILVALTIGFVTACTKDDSNETSIIGEWMRVTREGEPFIIYPEGPNWPWLNYYVFTKDGKFRMEAAVDNITTGEHEDFVEGEGIYTLDGDKITIITYDEYHNQDSRTKYDIIELTKEKLVIISEDGDKIYLKRV